MARSRNKYSRAARRAKARKPHRGGSGTWFTITMVVILVMGILGVLFLGGVIDDEAAAESPTKADHWHSAFAVNVCGEWLSDPAEFELVAGTTNVAAGIHSHGDGFIHIHPNSKSETGDGATLGRFLDYGGWSASEDDLEVWAGPSFAPGQTAWSNGDRCPDESGAAGKGKPGRVVFEVNCKPVSGNPSDHKLADQEVVAIGFLPRGESMGAPPNAASAPENDSATGAPVEAIDQAGCRPVADDNPGVASTTATTAPATTPTTTR